MLNQNFGTNLTIEKVDLSFLGNVQLKDVLAKNHHTDTLFYVHNLSTSIFSFRKLINGKFDFGQISLDEFIINIKTYKGEVDDALTVFIDNDMKSRYDLNTFILDTFKGQTVYIYENNRLPYKLQ